MRGVLLVAVLALLLALPLAGAHAIPITTSPASGALVATSPAEIRADFSEPLDPAATRLELIDAAGVARSLPPPRIEGGTRLLQAVPEPIPSGGYLVRWETISTADGHRTSGSWSFVVGEGALLPETRAVSENFRADAVGGKLLSYAGVALALAAAAFALHLHPSDANVPQAALRAWMRRGALAAFAGLGVFAWSQLDVSRLAPIDYFLGTTFGRGLSVRLVLAASLVVAAFAPFGVRARASLVALAALAGIAVAGASTHTTAYVAPRVFAVLVGGAHTAAVLLWTGGLALLFLHVRRLPRDGSTGEEAFDASVRFGHLAVASVVVATATGAVMFLALNGWDWRGWGAGPYAAALTLHTVLGVAMIGMGGVNRWIHVPRLRHAARADALGAFRTSVLHEALVALLVVALAAAITNLQPPSPEAPDAPTARVPIAFHALTGTHFIFHVEIDPGPALGRASEFRVHVTTLDGVPVTDAYRVQLRVTNLDANATGDVVQLEDRGEGRFRASGAYFPIGGRYEGALTIQTPEVFRDEVRWAMAPAR